jgi:proteasome lid subunit RPN8/RPN11
MSSTPDNSDKQASDDLNKDPKLSLDEWKSKKQVVHKRFDGPQTAQALLRVAISKNVYADITIHAKEFLDAEICGVLVGQVCEDDKGPFISVTAVIRGKSARQAKTHVTFTQETWNAIHAEKDKKFSDLQIVGWYHSHPGFGVEVSDMDRFIHKNFFPAQTQIALVTDPLGGDVAILVNTDQGLQYVDRFWVDGKEHKCCVPGKQPGTTYSANLTDSSKMLDAIDAVNTRLSQVVQTVDDMRDSLFKFLLTIGFVLCTVIVFAIGYHIYSSMTSKVEPPKLINYAPIPVQVGDKTVMLLVGVYGWQIPPELNAAYLQAELMNREAEAKKQAKGKSATGDTNATNDRSITTPNQPPKPQK